MKMVENISNFLNSLRIFLGLAPEKKENLLNLINKEPKLLQTLLKSSPRQIEIFANSVEAELQLVGFNLEGLIRKCGLKGLKFYYNTNFENWILNKLINRQILFNPSKNKIFRAKILEENEKDKKIIAFSLDKVIMEEDQFCTLIFVFTNIIIDPKYKKYILGLKLVKKNIYISYLRIPPKKIIPISISWDDLGIHFNAVDHSDTLRVTGNAYIYPNNI
jgi:hypothetical protein